jgi:hypothetical protein
MNWPLKRLAATLIVCGSVFTFAQRPAVAQDTEERPGNLGCDAYTWNISHELEVLGQPAISLNAGRDAKTLVLGLAHVDLEKRYAVKLVPQSGVKFAAKVGKPALDDGAQGGLISFRTAKAGKYRVSITSGHWLDVVDGGNLVVSRDFQGQRGCEKVRKVVEFELTGNHDFVLQLSGGTEANVGLAVTQVKSAT